MGMLEIGLGFEGNLKKSIRIHKLQMTKILMSNSIRSSAKALVESFPPSGENYVRLLIS